MAQLVQTDCPDPVLYVPSLQLMHVVAPEALLYDPAKQFEQSAAPARLYVPILHARQPLASDVFSGPNPYFPFTH